MTTLLDKKEKELEKKEEALIPFDPFAGFLASPFADVRRFAEEMDRLFGDFGIRRRRFFPLFRTTPEVATWVPNIEMFYKDETIVVRAELPGLKKEDVKVELVEGALTIEGERKYEKEVTKKGYFTAECSYGTFYRRIPLPEGVKTGEAKAIFKNGVLEVTIPAPALKKEAARRLEIKGA
jgi:HSP20 family protein